MTAGLAVTDSWFVSAITDNSESSLLDSTNHHFQQSRWSLVQVVSCRCFPSQEVLLWAILARACAAYSSTLATWERVTPTCLPSQMARSFSGMSTVGCDLDLYSVQAELHSLLLSGDDLFSAPKLSWSFANSNLGHLWHSLDSNHLPVPEMLWSTSYSKPLSAVPNTTACSFHSNPSPDTPSKGCSKTSASSEGNSETSSDSTPSDPHSTPMFSGDSLSCSGDRATPAASDIKGHVIKVIHNIKG